MHSLRACRATQFSTSRKLFYLLYLTKHYTAFTQSRRGVTYCHPSKLRRFYNPSGGYINDVSAGQGNSNGTLESGYILPTTGTYTITLFQTGSTAGQLTAKLLTYTNATGTIAFGVSTTMSTANLGQADDLTFSGTAGQTVSLVFDDGPSDTYPSNQVNLYLLNPSGGNINNVAAGQGNSNGVVVSGYTLPTTGTYTVHLYQNGSTAGQLTAKLTSP